MQGFWDPFIGDGKTFTLFCSVRPNGINAAGVFYEGAGLKGIYMKYTV